MSRHIADKWLSSRRDHVARRYVGSSTVAAGHDIEHRYVLHRGDLIAVERRWGDGSITSSFDLTPEEGYEASRPYLKSRFATLGAERRVEIGTCPAR
jgi:hypothetical protein